MDELPMVWSMLCWSYAMYLTPISYNLRARRVATLFVSYAAFYSIIHVYFAFTTTFQLMFGSLVIFSAFNLNKNCIIHTGRPLIPFTLHRTRLYDGLTPQSSSSSSSISGLGGGMKVKELNNLYTLCLSYCCVLLFAVSLWLFDQHVSTRSINVFFYYLLLFKSSVLETVYREGWRLMFVVLFMYY